MFHPATQRPYDSRTLSPRLSTLRHNDPTTLGLYDVFDPINPITQAAKFFNGDVGGLIAGRAARDGVIDTTDSVLILNKAYGLIAF